MSRQKTELHEQRQRLQDWGEQIRTQAEAFHRDRLALLEEVERALAWWRFGGGDGWARRVRMDELNRRAEGLLGLFERVALAEQQLATANGAVAAVGERRIGAADCIPTRLRQISDGLRRVGREVKLEDQLIGEQQRLDQLQREAERLAEALDLWQRAEAALGGVRADAVKAPLAAALPELAVSLCGHGPTDDWLAELKEKLGPLEQRLRRGEPPAIRSTDAIMRELPRWVAVLGERVPPAERDAATTLELRFRGKRRDFAAEDDGTFEQLLVEAGRLQTALAERAAAARAEALGELEGRWRLFSELVNVRAARVQEDLRELQQDEPASPHDHEDWYERLGKLRNTFEATVRGAEQDLLDRFRAYLADCQRRLETLGKIARLDEKDLLLRQAQAEYAALHSIIDTAVSTGLLEQVGRARALGRGLAELDQAMQADYADLQRQREGLSTRAQWLHEQAGLLVIALPAGTPAAADLADANRRHTDLQQERHSLADNEQRLQAAEVAFAGACVDAIEAVRQRGQAIAGLLGPARVVAAAPEPAAPGADADAPRLARAVRAHRERLASLETLLETEEARAAAHLVELTQTLRAVPTGQLGPAERQDQALVLEALQGWAPDPNRDPLARLDELRILTANAALLLEQVSEAASRLRERREGLRQRLKAFKNQFLHAYCPELSRRVEGLLHPPAQVRWPRDAEVIQLEEAEALLRRIECHAERLAAREVAENLALLRAAAERNADANALALIGELTGLPPEVPPPAHLRRRLALLTAGQRRGR